MVLSLHKQLFVTTHFQFITAHFVRHCALKNALTYTVSVSTNAPTLNQRIDFNDRNIQNTPMTTGSLMFAF